MHRKALEEDEKIGHLDGVARHYTNLGRLFVARGDLDEARTHWTKARDLYARIGIPHMVEKLHGWLDDLPTD